MYALNTYMPNVIYYGATDDLYRRVQIQCS